MYTCLWVVEPYRLYSAAAAIAAASMQVEDLAGERPAADGVEGDGGTASR